MGEVNLASYNFNHMQMIYHFLKLLKIIFVHELEAHDTHGFS